ncbi:MAG: HlyD family efflux transporter periplasmic adaptor subunit [Lachnospiraceae bacterium]|nr:HlyD family efflux transporter periplasmic adaptor subunit [Lachnospiraceae bacterium]
MKTLKKFVVTVIVLAIIIGGSVIGIRIYKQHKVNTTSIEGTSVSTLNNAEWLSYQTTSYSTGLVSSNSKQSIYYATDKTITEVKVKEGDTVNVGDVLLVYDTAQSDLKVEKQEIEIQQIANEITLEQRKLEKLKNTTPVPDEETEDDDDDDDDVDVDAVMMLNTPMQDGDAYNYINKEAKAYTGKGTSENPYRFLCTEECYVYGSYLNWLIEKGKVAVFEVYEGNDLSRGDIVSSWKADGNKMSSSYADDDYISVVTKKEVTFATVEDLDDGSDDDDDDDSTSDEETYTEKELKEAIEECEKNLKELDLKKRKQELELQKIKASLDSAEVTATISGEVTKVADLSAEDLSSSDVIVEVSAKTGCYITGNITELLLGTLKTGDTIQATSWSNNQTYTATITEISEIPTSESGYYSYGSNSNVSYYPFTAYIEDGEGLDPGDALDLSISGTSDEVASIILEKSYVRKENGNYYVYKADENDKLVKQYVKTGKTYEGYYIEIKEGLSENDFIVFPYGTNVKEGVTVEHDEIYNDDDSDYSDDVDTDADDVITDDSDGIVVDDSDVTTDDSTADDSDAGVTDDSDSDSTTSDDDEEFDYDD